MNAMVRSKCSILITKEKLDNYDCCEHLKIGDKLVWTTIERDSFGVVGVYYSCEKCHNETEETCSQCGKDFPLNQLIMFNDYYYDPRQGDEESYYCKCCQATPEHQARVEKKKQDGLENDDYGEDDDFGDDDE